MVEDGDFVVIAFEAVVSQAFDEDGRILVDGDLLIVKSFWQIAVFDLRV